MIYYLNLDPTLPLRNRLEDVQRGKLLLIVQDCYRLFHMHMPPRPDMPVHPDVVWLDTSVFPPPASCRSLVETAVFVIMSFRMEARCSAYNCLNSIQSAGRDFQRCASCAVVSYCGRECQRKAWKEEKYPHKSVCRALRTVLEKGGGADNFFECASGRNLVRLLREGTMRQNIIDRLKTSNVSEEDLELIEDWYKYMGDAKVYPMPDGSEWTPGYDNYDKVIEQLSAPGRGVKGELNMPLAYHSFLVPDLNSARYMNRLARWPSEVAKEERMLKQQPFWQEDVE